MKTPALHYAGSGLLLALEEREPGWPEFSTYNSPYVEKAEFGKFT